MNFELDIFELSNLLSKIQKNYKLNIMVKSVQSGGWLTINGEAVILKSAVKGGEGCGSKFNNILHIKILDHAAYDGAVIKLTGAKDKKFKVSLNPAKAMQISKDGSRQMIIKENESTLKVDDNIVFSIDESAEKIKTYIEE
ncbi:MAG: UDP-N-acetylglucosamine pyrophosphorylase [Clostridium sp.]|nr:UDP-N-acetylglucosamine pyrophosphorylase [Clostridium sp.]